MPFTRSREFQPSMYALKLYAAKYSGTVNTCHHLDWNVSVWEGYHLHESLINLKLEMLRLNHQVDCERLTLPTLRQILLCTNPRTSQTNPFQIQFVGPNFLPLVPINIYRYRCVRNILREDRLSNKKCSNVTLQIKGYGKLERVENKINFL
jgi:hypothetical protein